MVRQTTHGMRPMRRPGYLERGSNMRVYLPAVMEITQFICYLYSNSHYDAIYAIVAAQQRTYVYIHRMCSRNGRWRP